ncbi:hypothetical protein, partial [Nocardia farcinica]|uniref:hypothetical protein n=1 Tax=Nocardia farcinica TaxID=37329 RepID=UPI001E2B6BA4
VSTGVPSRQRANAGLDQNPVTSSIIFREGAPSRDPQVLIIARLPAGTRNPQKSNRGGTARRRGRSPFER